MKKDAQPPSLKRREFFRQLMQAAYMAPVIHTVALSSLSLLGPSSPGMKKPGQGFR